jgi:LysM repeat protein
MTQYTVRHGDSLSLIARRYKVATWQKIYYDPANADFRRLRPNPNLIYPGDVVFVPDGKGAPPSSLPAPEPLKYHVGGIFQKIAQRSDNICWAAVYTMMQRWKFHNEKTVGQALQALDDYYVSKYLQDEGLDATEIPMFLFKARLTAEAPTNHTPQGWSNLLRAYGPLWVGTLNATLTDRHSRMVIGINGDGSPKCTWMEIIDPDPDSGLMYVERFDQFLETYEGGYYDGLDPDYAQIRHW